MQSFMVPSVYICLTKWYDIKYITLIFLSCWPFYLKKIPTPYKIIRSVIYNDSFNPTRIREVHIPDGVSAAVCRNETFPTSIRQTFPFTINSFFATTITVKSILWIGESKQCKVLCKRRRRVIAEKIAFFYCLCVFFVLVTHNSFYSYGYRSTVKAYHEGSGLNLN